MPIGSQPPANRGQSSGHCETRADPGGTKERAQAEPAEEPHRPARPDNYFFVGAGWAGFCCGVGAGLAGFAVAGGVAGLPGLAAGFVGWGPVPAGFPVGGCGFAMSSPW